MRSGSVVTANEPIPLDTITRRGSPDLRNSGRNAAVTRTGPSTLTPYTGRKSAATVSAGPAKVPPMPALFTSTSIRPDASATVSRAAATDASDVTSSSICRTSAAGSAFASRATAAAPRSVSRDPSQTVQPSSASPSVVSKPIPLLAPVIRAICSVVMWPSLRASARA